MDDRRLLWESGGEGTGGEGRGVDGEERRAKLEGYGKGREGR